MAQEDLFWKYLSSVFTPQAAQMMPTNGGVGVYPHSAVPIHMFSDPQSLQCSPLNSALMQNPFMFSLILPHLSTLCASINRQSVTVADAATQTEDNDFPQMPCSPKLKIAMEKDVEEHFKRSLGTKFPAHVEGSSVISTEVKHEADVDYVETEQGNSSLSPTERLKPCAHEEKHCTPVKRRKCECEASKTPSPPAISKQRSSPVTAVTTESVDVDDHFRKALGSKWASSSSPSNSSI